MAIRAADYSIGFDTQAAKAEMVALEKAIMDGSVDIKTAFSQMSTSFNQVVNVHRTGNKEVDAFTKLIKDEKQETRTLGFMMRSTSESVGTLSSALGGPSGVGRSIQAVYSQFDQMTFGLEALSAAGEKAGGKFKGVAAAIGEFAVPAGIAMTAFGMLNEIVRADAEQVAILTGRIRALDIEAGRITLAEQIKDARAELERIKAEIATRPDIDVEGWFLSIAEGFGSGSADFVAKHKQAQDLADSEKVKLAEKRLRELEDKSGDKGRSQVMAAVALNEAMVQNIEAQLQFKHASGETLSFLNAQYDVHETNVIAMQGLLQEMRTAGFESRELLAFETRITQEMIKQRELKAKISNRVAGDDVYGSEQYKQSARFLQEAEETARKLRAMEDRNAPRRIISHITVAEGVVGAQDALRRLDEEYNAFAIQGGDIIANSLTSGFTRGFSSGKLLLSDFTSSMLQSLLQIAAQESAISIVSGLLSFLGAGPFGAIAGMLGSHIFSGGAGGGSNIKGGGKDFGGIKGRISTGAGNDATMRDLVAAVDRVASKTDEVRHQVRQSRPALYVGGVTSPDAIVTENIGIAERRRARRLK